MTRIAELKRILGMARKFSYIPVSLREDILNLERELIALESGNENSN